MNIHDPDKVVTTYRNVVVNVTANFLVLRCHRGRDIV